MKWLVFIVMLLPTLVMGGQIVLESDSLPYTTQAKNDTITISGDSIHAAGNGITIAHDSVVIEGFGDTLFFNTGDNDSTFGVRFNTGVDSSRINNLVIKHLGTYGANGPRYTVGVAVYNINSAIIDTTTIIVYGHDAHCVNSYEMGSGMKGLEINNSFMYDSANSFSIRDHYDGFAMRFQSRPASWSDGEFALKIYNTQILTAPGGGIALQGGDITRRTKGIDISYCSTYVDHHSDSTPDAFNAFALLLTDVGDSVRVHHNYFGAGTEEGGSEGLAVFNSDGTVAYPIQIDSNVVDINTGPVRSLGNNNVEALRIRAEGNNGRISYVNVFDNNFKTTVDSGGGFGDAYGPDGTCFAFNSHHHPLQTGADYENHINIYNNVFENRLLTARDAGVSGEALEITYSPYDTTIKFWNNKYIGFNEIVNIFGNDQGEVAGLTFTNDTLEFDTITLSPLTFSYGYSNGALSSNCTTNAFMDIVTVGAADIEDITFVGTNELDIRFMRSVDLYIIDGDDTPISGAFVWGMNDLVTDSVFAKTTGAPGRVVDTLTIHYEEENRASADSTNTNLNTFTFWAKSGTDSASIVVTLTDSTANQGSAVIDTIQISGAEAPAVQRRKGFRL